MNKSVYLNKVNVNVNFSAFCLHLQTISIRTDETGRKKKLDEHAGKFIY